jgi:beta-galactosidase
MLEMDQDGEYFIEVAVVRTDRPDWAEPRHVEASEQLAMRSIPVALDQIDCRRNDLAAYEDENSVTFSNRGFSVTFDKADGEMTSLVFAGLEMIYKGEGFRFNWFRTISNDKETYLLGDEVLTMDSFSWNWEKEAQVAKLQTEMTANIYDTFGRVQDCVAYKVVYSIYADGIVDVDASFTTDNDCDIPRLGLVASVTPGYENVKWYGRGPHENYSDRECSAYFGIYEDTVDGMVENYLRSQTMGNRGDVRWLTLTDDCGQGMKITAGGDLAFSALHARDRDLTYDIKHTHELYKIQLVQTILTLDCIQNGLGNASCGPGPLPEYLIKNDSEYRYSFRLEGLK